MMIINYEGGYDFCQTLDPWKITIFSMMMMMPMVILTSMMMMWRMMIMMMMIILLGLQGIAELGQCSVTLAVQYY